MNTPICDFVRRYAEQNVARLHMPGHKGIGPMGIEGFDITEIEGADSLYEASGIIRESEENASRLFGCETFYSAEGSSQCIRAMLHLVLLYAKQQGRKPVIAAARNVHKTFLSAAALLDLDVVWLCSETQDSYLSCRLSAEDLDAALTRMEEKPAAIYLTSPDYLGNLQDIRALSEVTHQHGVLLVVDNAHGAYLRFLQPSQHPIDLGADLCCDSAHKTLPVLTGGAYLHISPSAPKLFGAQVKNALALFGSTSPSYLILQSLDAVNAYLADGYGERLSDFVLHVQALKDKLAARGYLLQGDEPLKLTIATKNYGYRGRELADLLLRQGIVCEFSDPDFLVMMLTPETGEGVLNRLEQALLSISAKDPINEAPPVFCSADTVMSIRNAMLSPAESLPVSNCIGRVLAAASVGCPPAVPVVISGERIDAHAAECFSYYGIECCAVVTE